jgi:hypothetical protein
MEAAQRRLTHSRLGTILDKVLLRKEQRKAEKSVPGGRSADDPPTVYLYEGYQSTPSECKLWVFTP